MEASGCTGANGGKLLNGYTTGGGAHFQVIRVPQYNAPAIGAALVPPAWNGTAGGILAIDVQNILNGNGATIAANARGFRGGQGRGLAGAASAGNGDYVNSNAKAAHGQKAEGTAGTPNFVYAGGTGTQTLGSATADGYPGGDTGRGAPGNAGGGGADANVAANDQNSGGGGGGNGGAGGVGGNCWNTAHVAGGLGGAAFAASNNPAKAVMGGGSQVDDSAWKRRV